ncbi:DNA cytosine methyltransferase [Eggerthella sinensis]|uniref:DNA cytosine methyltransferase n=1 Tax=Eggerthella sinensis TaxID=242230 RepID=UPI001D065575|nr:DNA (cytosine-5-)-methyltransferase [Eggerthella sinensis]MCB7037494.1 DNA (cytosine-5-)-methyltransferase [Eggerthella sinensis]
MSEKSTLDSKSMKVVDLFSGCGGLSKGFELAGFNIVAAFENNEGAIKCYNDNFESHKAIKQDLSNVIESIQRIAEHSPDVIIGGPPCQDFSTAGRRIEGKRAALTEAYAKIVTSIKPEYFLMENVSRAKESSSYLTAKRLVKNAGYGLTERVVDSSLHGVPQRRKRFIVIGHLDDSDGFLDEFIEAGENIIPMTVRRKYPDFPVEHYYRHPRTYQRRAVFSIDEPAPTMRGINRPRPANYVPHKSDSSTSPNIRALSFKERALLQTFPPTFRWEAISNSTEIEQLIGNAVPVELAHRMGLYLKKYIDSNSPEHPLSFFEWLRENRSLSLEGAKDVISHLRRANKYEPLPEQMLSSSKYLDTLKLNDGFLALSPSARQHLSRAIDLLFAYYENANTLEIK